MVWFTALSLSSESDNQKLLLVYCVLYTVYNIDFCVVLLFTHLKKKNRSRLPNNKTYSFLSTKRNNFTIGTSIVRWKFCCWKEEEKEKENRKKEKRVKKKHTYAYTTAQQSVVHLACFHAHIYVNLLDDIQHCVVEHIPVWIHCEFNIVFINFTMCNAHQHSMKSWIILKLHKITPMNDSSTFSPSANENRRYNESFHNKIICKQ